MSKKNKTPVTPVEQTPETPIVPSYAEFQEQHPEFQERYDRYVELSKKVSMRVYGNEFGKLVEATSQRFESELDALEYLEQNAKDSPFKQFVILPVYEK